MENNRAKYKRVIINWLVIILFGGLHVWMIFAYFHQWRDNPLSKSGLIIMSIIWIFIYILFGRFKVIIDDNYAIFRSDVWIGMKIPIPMIDNVSTKQVPLSLMSMYLPGYNFNQFEITRNVVKIQMKNGKIYQIAIKNAEKIKEEIEKRMTITNNKPQ